MEYPCDNCGQPYEKQATVQHGKEWWCLDCMRLAGHCLSCDAYIPAIVEDYYNYEDDRCPNCVKNESI